MTRKAHALGMTRTFYRNASGLPNDEQVTTARDQAVARTRHPGTVSPVLPLLRDADPSRITGCRCAITTTCLAMSRVSTESRPGTPRHRGSTSSPRCAATAATSWRWCWAVLQPPPATLACADLIEEYIVAASPQNRRPRSPRPRALRVAARSAECHVRAMRPRRARPSSPKADAASNSARTVGRALTRSARPLESRSRPLTWTLVRCASPRRRPLTLSLRITSGRCRRRRSLLLRQRSQRRFAPAAVVVSGAPSQLPSREATMPTPIKPIQVKTVKVKLPAIRAAAPGATGSSDAAGRQIRLSPTRCRRL